MEFWKAGMSNPAESYENYMVPALFAPWASRLVQSAHPQPGERVLDLACGTGIVARLVASLLGENGPVTGFDLNLQMLTVARAAAERQQLAISWREGRAEQLPFPDNSFDLVLCQFGLMFFADRKAALAEIHRVLAKGGRLFLSVWQSLDRHPFYKTLHAVVQARVGKSAVQDISSIDDPAKLRTELSDASFGNVGIDPVSMTAQFPNPDGFLAAEIDVDAAAIPSMQKLDDSARQALVAAITEDMKTPLREATQDDRVVLPFHAFLVGAEK
jgi:ubiquinone/menaquinone biosynthesis C-methylase UbiE